MVAAICLLLIFILGVFVGYLVMHYRDGHNVGQMVITINDEGKKIIFLELNKDPETFEHYKMISFKLTDRPSPDYEPL
jgi:hypothetical protein